MICKFDKLNTLAVKKIVVKFLSELNESTKEKAITLRFDESLIDHVADTGYDDKMGARPLQRKIDELVKVPLSKKILFDNLEGKALTISWKDGLVIEGATPQLPLSNEQGAVDGEGYIVLDQFKPKS